VSETESSDVVTVLAPSRSGSDPARRAASATWFWPTLLATTVGGAAIRVAFAVSQLSRPLPGDGNFYYQTGKLVANGTGFEGPSLTGPLHLVPTAQHPPVLPAVLAVFDLIGLHSIGAQRIVLSLLAAAAVPLMGVLGRKVTGPLAGLVAAGLAAVSPLWFQPSGILMSESLYLVAIPAMLLIALACLERPTVWRFGGLGISIGLATLIRSEALDFVVLVGALVLVLVAAPWRIRFASAVALVVGLALVLTPWFVRNEVQLGGLALSDNIGSTFSGSYCPSAIDAKQPDYGTWNFACTVRAQDAILKEKPPKGSSSWTEVTLNDRMVSDSWSYIRSHLSEMPGTVVAREEAMTDVGDLGYQLQYAAAEGRSRPLEELGIILDWLLVPFAVVGAVVVARRNWRVFTVIAMPFVVVVANVAVFYGSTRMRVAAEPSLALLGATGIVAAVTKLRRRPKGAETTPDGAEHGAPTEPAPTSR
jgi:4-amino-4-deoxy-L-arabinose transferase-like glycosyltransferase